MRAPFTEPAARCPLWVHRTAPMTTNAKYKILKKHEEKYLMYNALFYSQLNVDSPDARRVILIPMETTLYRSENAHTESNHFGDRPYA